MPMILGILATVGLLATLIPGIMTWVALAWGIFVVSGLARTWWMLGRSFSARHFYVYALFFNTPSFIVALVVWLR